MSKRDSLFVVAACLYLLGMSSSAQAQPAPPQVREIAPKTIERGRTVELAIRGTGLAAVSAVQIDRPAGSKAELVRADKPDDKLARIRLTVPTSADPGICEVRLFSPGGPSRPIRLQVTQLPGAAETEPNDGSDQAQPVALPALLVGTIARAGDLDLFQFQATKGEQLVFDVHAAREGSPLDSVLTLYDPRGRALASSNDAAGLDSVILLQAPADGRYTLEIRDLQYRGGGNYKYRIRCGAIPFLKSIFPISGKQGSRVSVETLGFNLGDRKRIDVDLAPGSLAQRQVTVRKSDLLSNALPFEVHDLPVAVEAEPNNQPAQAMEIQFPRVINGRIDRPGDVDLFRFHVERKQKVPLEILARRFGSPIDPLLILRNSGGAVIQRNDDAVGADARLAADLGPGQYTVEVHDLLHGGGADHVYRLSVGAMPASRPDFAVRFLPDAPRVGRDGHVRVWAEVRSLNGFKGEVALTLTKAPPGVSAAPVTLAAGSSGVFTLRADPKAPLGTHAIQLQAVAVGGPDKVKRSAEAEHGGQVAAGAYLTVFQPAPFAVRPLGELSGEVLEAYKSQLADLEKKLHAPDPKLAAAQGGWEKKLGKSPSWVTLKLQDLSSRSGVRFTVAGDGSVRAGGPVNPDRETYTGFAQTDMKGIRAIRLEALADKKLPAGGPGRAPNGNFVLSTFSVTAAKAGDSSTAKPVAWQKVEADFSQANWAVAGAIDTNPKTGWAVSPKFGVNHAAVFRTAEPLGLDGGTRLAFTIDQPYGGQHTLGRFRISVTTDPNATLKKTPVGAVPADILAILRTPAGKRKAADAEKLSRHYRSIAPQLQPLRARMAQIRSIIGPALELQSLRQQLQRPDAKVEAAAAAWEKKLAAALSSNNPPAFGDWYHVGPFSGGDMNAVFNKAFGPEQKVDLKQKFAKGKLAWKAHPEWKDGVIHNPFTAANAANYIARTVTVGAPRKLALSLGSDDGIKVFLNGKPVLANNVGRGAAADQEKLTVDLVSGENRILIKVINGGGPSGFYFKAADKGVGVPPPVLAILKTPADKRDAKQKKALLAYYRETVDPELRKIREKIARIEKQVGGTFPPVGIRNQDVVLPVLLERRGDFSGPVKITVEGFSTGRDPKTGQPKAIAANIATKPVTLGAADSLAMLSLKPSAKSEVGARAVVLRAEAKVGAETWVQYSEAFDLTVKAK